MSLTTRLSVYWFFMTGAFGVFFPFFTLYLKEGVGLTGSEVGVVFAIPPLVGTIAPAFWAQIADRTGARARTLAWLAVGTSVGYLGLMLPGRVAEMVLASVTLAIFSSALVPMAVAVSLAGLRGDAPAFGRVRVWGTVGYLLTVVATPPLLHATQRIAGWRHADTSSASEPGLGSIFVLASVLTCIAAGIAWSLPQTAELSLRAERGAYRVLWREHGYVRLLAFCFAGYVFLQGPMILFPVYVRSRGGDMETLSYLWIWMLVLEIPLVAYAGRLFDGVGPRKLVTLGTAAGGLRWLACALTRDPWILYPLQLLHAVLVAGLLVGAALYAERLVPDRLRSTGQAGLVVFGWNVGAVLSSLLGGAMLDAWGIDAVFAVGGAGALAVATCARWILPTPPPRVVEK